MAKDPKFPVRMQINLTEVQAQRITDMRFKYGCQSDSETVRELLTAMFEILDKDPQKDD